ncbi:bud emergence protein 1 [Puccinia graminis f. sp. tritici]|uniref:Bud emergence protein 1 n=1 Tax=Puccinia graminis f. sp. tritici TaxID=56615 RepID=A0A5B0MJK5_PUCGR|nr:bud emergence protein 1 [Puccinia graminis f. sp. tritici]
MGQKGTQTTLRLRCFSKKIFILCLMRKLVAHITFTLGSWHGAVGDPSAYNHSKQSSANTPWNAPTNSYSNSQQSLTQQGQGCQDKPYPPQSGPKGDGYATVEELREQHGVVVHASVESFHFDYWFHLRAHFSRISEDGRDGQTTILALYCLYEDFYDFQATLIDI